MKRIVCGCLGMMWIGLAALSVPAQAEEARFLDDFNRAEIGKEWNVTPNHNDCPPPKTGRKPPRSPEAPSADNKTAPYDDISREIDKKSGKKGSAKSAPEAKKVPDEPFQGVTARIRDGMLYFQYAENQDAQMVQREFPGLVTRLSYEFTPLYAMGGLDDRAWIGVRIFYLDATEMILGEIRHFFYQSDFPERENSATVHAIVQKGSFDGTVRQADIDLQRILEQRLRGVDRKRIAKTRISFEAATGICSSSVEANVDNVAVTQAEGAQPIRVNREMLLEIAELGSERYSRERQGFPGNWKNAIFDKFGRAIIQTWLNELPGEVRNDPVRLTDHLAQRYGLTGRDAWWIGHTVTLLLQAMQGG
ncbi:MAG: hypothetical protein HQL91_03890 [Magnetococcales bacterium]|nr:hypothetical protein [Magnetococcales bacterium]